MQVQTMINAIIVTFFVLCAIAVAEATGFAVWSYLPLLGGSAAAVWLWEVGHRDYAAGAALLGILLQAATLLLAKRHKAGRNRVYLDS
ncbi:MAG: hypothetical protein P8164_11740 [Gammaproteobacteria bacterium]|jgi:hypothetical protein